MIKNSEIKNPEIIRKDIALDINDECFIWITYDKYKEVFNSIVNKDEEFNNINKMTDLIEQLDLIDENEIINLLTMQGEEGLCIYISIFE